MPETQTRQVVELGYAGSERLVMNMGPQHPSAHGVFRMLLTLEGETVVAMDAIIGYLHRCHEKLGETLTYVQYPSIASKTDYVAAMTSELAYVSAVEALGTFEVPRRAQYLRVLVAELQRIASHCLWLGGSASPRTASGSARGAWTWAGRSGAAPRCSSTASASARTSSIASRS